MANWISEKLSINLNGIDWKPSRIDYCYFWILGEDIKDYLSSFSNCPVYQYTRSPYVDDNNRQQGFTWRSKNRKINMYNKDLETGVNLGGMLRFEIQNLNRQSIKTIEESVSENLLSCISAKKLLNRWLERAGLTNGVVGKIDLLMKLIDKYGYEGATSRYMFIETYKKLGCGAKKVMSEVTYKRRRSEASKNGWLVSNDENKHLKGLIINEIPNTSGSSSN
jgi:hypothetical protein